MVAQLFTAKRVYTGKEVYSPGAVFVVDGKIVKVGPAQAGWSLPTDTQFFDFPTGYIVPGYIDIHHHGAGGGAYDEGEAPSRQAISAHQHHGTARCLLSYVTGSVAEMSERIAVGAKIVQSDPRALGLHLEGPFLDPGHKGAHPERHLCDPTPERIEQLLAAGQGAIKQITIAPERTGALEAIKRLAEAGVISAVGHCNADYETARAAFNAGARILTHAFNAMNPIHHRKPGPVIAALQDERVWLELINDGIHVHASVVKSVFEQAAERMVMVTDAMAAACQADGEYMLGELPVYVREGVARLVEGDNLAGSTLTMDQSVAGLVNRVGVDLATAVAAATINPAQAIGVADQFGQLAAGFPADLLVLDPQSLLPEHIFLADEQGQLQSVTPAHRM